jgi:hypothetical protein
MPIQSGQNRHPGTLLGVAIVVLLAALIVSGLTVAQFSLALPAGADENFFETNTTEDDFDALRQRARGALQTLIEKQQANGRRRSVAATERMR